MSVVFNSKKLKEKEVIQMGEDLNYNYYSEPGIPNKKDDCEVTATDQIPLTREATQVVVGEATLRRLKVPVVLKKEPLKLS